MSCVNKVMMLGNLTRDPELRYLPNGTACLEFTLALNNSYTKKDGQKVDEVSFIDCVKMGDGAEKIVDYLKKGRQLHVEGRLKQDRWETDQGEKRNKIRVMADRLTFVGSGGGKKDDAAPAPDSTDDVRV